VILVSFHNHFTISPPSQLWSYALLRSSASGPKGIWKRKEEVNKSNPGLESGVDEAGAQKFPGGSVTYGSAATGRGDNREIPEREGGSIDAKGR
jgi:hypothetical protein